MSGKRAITAAVALLIVATSTISGFASSRRSRAPARVGTTTDVPRRPVRNYANVLALLTTATALVTAIIAIGTLSNTSQQFEVSSRQIEQGQVTDRYIRAVAQLGDPSPDVRLGSIYALGRLARDSSSDQPAVTDVLSAYVRNHVTNARDAACGTMAMADTIAPPPLSLANDVRAAIQVLGGLNARTPAPLDQNLVDVCLPRTDIIARATLSGVNLVGANLVHAIVGYSDLHSADLSNADLRFAGIRLANLRDAHLVGANLAGADLSGTDLSGADLSGANLAGANVTMTNLSGTHSAHLVGTIGVPAQN